VIGYITDTRVSRHGDAVTAVAVESSRIATPKSTLPHLHTPSSRKTTPWRGPPAGTRDLLVKSLAFAARQLRQFPVSARGSL